MVLVLVQGQGQGGERGGIVSVGAAPFVGVGIGEVGRSGLNEGWGEGRGRG